MLWRSVHYNSQRCIKWVFFAGTDDIVGPEGMEKFCEDIGVEPENVSLRSTQKVHSVLWCWWTCLTSLNFPSRIKKIQIEILEEKGI